MDYKSELKFQKQRLEKELSIAVEMRNRTHVKHDSFMPLHQKVVDLRMRIAAINDRIFYCDKPNTMLDNQQTVLISQYVK